MDKEMENVGLDYNTQRGKLRMPEYGRNVQKMIEYVKSLPEKEKRDEQARAVIRVMDTLNVQGHQQENWEQKLWDHLHAISGFDIDVDSPYPAPEPGQLSARPAMIPVKRKPIKATHYGRNIEGIIDLIADQPEGDTKTAMIRSLAIYMRQQYLIWNKDSVSDETIFQDIEKLSDYRIKVPEGMQLTRISSNAVFAKPSLNPVKSGNSGVQRQRTGNAMRQRMRNNH